MMTTADIDDELDETPLTQAEIDLLNRLVDEWHDLAADEEKIKNRKREVADLLIGKLGIGGSHYSHPNVGVRIQRPANVFKAHRAREVLDANQLAAISELTPSAELARQLLPPVLYGQLTVPNARPSVHSV